MSSLLFFMWSLISVSDFSYPSIDSVMFLPYAYPYSGVPSSPLMDFAILSFASVESASQTVAAGCVTCCVSRSPRYIASSIAALLRTSATCNMLECFS